MSSQCSQSLRSSVTQLVHIFSREAASITLVSFTLGTWHWSHSSESKETSSVVARLQTSVSLFRRASCSGPMHRVSQYIATASPEHFLSLPLPLLLPTTFTATAQ